jgi:hypothetical protein
MLAPSLGARLRGCDADTCPQGGQQRRALAVAWASGRKVTRVRSIAAVNQFGHVDLRVADLAAAVSFYEELMPAFCFTERYHGEDWKVWAASDPRRPSESEHRTRQL